MRLTKNGFLFSGIVVTDFFYPGSGSGADGIVLLR